MPRAGAARQSAMLLQDESRIAARRNKNA